MLSTKPKKKFLIQKKDLEVDYSNYDNDEIPNDFICFNVPISQNLRELTHNDLFSPQYNNNTRVSLDSSISSSSSNISSPNLSDDSFIFPNFHNNVKIFNKLDNEVQNLTLEFNSSLSFLKNEKLTQLKINKKKLKLIQKKINHQEKNWINLLNKSYKSKNHENVLTNKEFLNQFNIEINKLFNSFDYLNEFNEYLKKFNNNNLKNFLIKNSNLSISPRNFTNSVVLNTELPTKEFVPNLLDDDYFELENCANLNFNLQDLRIKKKYCLPSETMNESIFINDNYSQDSITSRNSVFSNTSTTSISSSPKLNKFLKFPSWYDEELSVSPLPSLLLNFPNELSLKGLVWYLSINKNGLIVNESTYLMVNNETVEFLKNFDNWEFLIVTKKIHDLQKFKFQLKIYKQLVDDLRICDLDIRKNLKLVILNFYSYCFDILHEKICYNKEIISLTLLVYENLHSNHLTFNCLINLVNNESFSNFFRKLLINNDLKFSNLFLKLFTKNFKNQLHDTFHFFKGQFSLNVEFLNEFVLLITKKIFSLGNFNDKLFLRILNKVFDILIIENNVNILVYLITIFLKNYSNDFKNHYKSEQLRVFENLIKFEKIQPYYITKKINYKNILQKSVKFSLKIFVEGLNNKENELLFKFNNLLDFTNDLKNSITKDLSTGLSIDDIMEFENLELLN